MDGAAEVGRFPDEARPRPGRRDGTFIGAVTVVLLGVVVVAGALLLTATIGGRTGVGWGWAAWIVVLAGAVRCLLDRLLRDGIPPS